MDDPYYPWEAFIPLRDARYDPEAEPSLELCSGAFIWPDEKYGEFVAVCRSLGKFPYYETVVFRSSLILGCPREECRRGWEELRRFVPQWPGFRPERCSETLRAALEQALAAEDY